MRDRVAREQEGALHPERPEDEVVERGLGGHRGRDLEDPRGDREAGVAVRPQRPERRELLDRREVRHVTREGVVADAGVVEDVAEPAAVVREEVPKSHAGRDVLVLEP